MALGLYKMYVAWCILQYFTAAACPWVRLDGHPWSHVPCRLMDSFPLPTPPPAVGGGAGAYHDDQPLHLPDNQYCRLL